MKKPKINLNVNLNFDITSQTPLAPSWDDTAILSFKQIINQLRENFDIAHEEPPTSEKDSPPTSRHYKSVTANTRISNAIEYINDEIWKNNYSGNDTAKMFREIKQILLGK